jgi:hypothetical protein
MNVIKAWLPPLAQNGACAQHAWCTAAITAKLIASPSADALRVAALVAHPNMPALQMLAQDLHNAPSKTLKVDSDMFPDKQLMEVAARTSLHPPHALRTCCTSGDGFIDLKIPDGFCRNNAQLYRQVVEAYAWRASQPPTADWTSVNRFGYDVLRFHYAHQSPSPMSLHLQLPQFEVSRPDLLLEVMIQMARGVTTTYASTADFLDKRVVADGALRTDNHVRDMAKSKI